jgi:hypothetical protein
VNQPKLVEDKEHRLLGGRRITHDEFDKRVRGLIRVYNLNELAIAVSFARRTICKIDAIADALRRFNLPY